MNLDAFVLIRDILESLNRRFRFWGFELALPGRPRQEDQKRATESLQGVEGWIMRAATRQVQGFCTR